MAKGSQLNLFEQHLEKAVFGVCLLLLAYAVLHWVVSSPRTVDLSGRPVGPDQVDKELLATAQAVKEGMDKALPPATGALPPYSTRMDQDRANPFPADIRLADVGMPQPEMKTSDEITGKTLAVSDITPVVPAPEKAKPWIGFELPNVGEKPADLVAAHVAVEYPLNTLRHALEVAVKGTTVNVTSVFLGVEAEVQEKQPDDTWGPIRKVKAAFRPPIDSAGKEMSPPPIPEFDGKNAKEIHDVVDTLGQPAWQAAILEPDYWQVFWPDHTWGTWEIHLPKNSVSDTAPKETTPGTTTPPAYKAPVAAPTLPPGIARPGSGSGFPGAPSSEEPPLPPIGRTQLPGRPLAPSPTPPPRIHTPAPGGRSTTKPTRTALAEVAAAVPVPTPVPPMLQQIEGGRILAWVHDMHLNISRYYRYRVRLVLVNPLLALPATEAKTPEDARQIAIATPFSEWSDPVIVPTATRFFLTGGSEMLDKGAGAVTVTVFTSCLGQPVSHTFQVGLGQMIGAKVDKDVINPADGKRVKSPADFSTGAMVVDFDFSKPFRRGTMLQRTVEVIYVDENGNVGSRIRAIDESSAEYQKLLGDAKRTDASAAAAPVETGGPGGS